MAARPLAAMVLAGLAGSALLTALSRGEGAGAIALGMLGPLTAAAGTWVLVQRTHRREPARVPRVMIALFAAKLVLVGGYVAAALTLLPAGTVPFVVSFVSHYVLLHAIEALYLRRLFAGGAGDAAGWPVARKKVV